MVDETRAFFLSLSRKKFLFSFSFSLSLPLEREKFLYLLACNSNVHKKESPDERNEIMKKKQ